MTAYGSFMVTSLLLAHTKFSEILATFLAFKAFNITRIMPTLHLKPIFQLIKPGFDGFHGLRSRFDFKFI